MAYRFPIQSLGAITDEMHRFDESMILSIKAIRAIVRIHEAIATWPETRALRFGPWPAWVVRERPFDWTIDA